MEEFVQKGKQYADEGNYTSAIATFDEAIEKYPNERRLYHNRVFCYYQMNDFENGLREAELLVEKFPEYARGHYRKGRILSSLKKPRLYDAMRCYEIAIDLSPPTRDGKELQEDAKFALQEVKIQILKEGNKFSRWQAGRACLSSTISECSTGSESSES